MDFMINCFYFLEISPKGLKSNIFDTARGLFLRNIVMPYTSYGSRKEIYFLK